MEPVIRSKQGCWRKTEWRRWGGPQAALEQVGERLKVVLEQDSSLESQWRSVTNAYSLYRKTRPSAAGESVKRARSLPADGIHPLLAKAMPGPALAGLDAQACSRQTPLPFSVAKAVGSVFPWGPVRPLSRDPLLCPGHGQINRNCAK